MVKNVPANAGAKGDAGSILGLGRFPAEGNSNLLPYSCLKNPMNCVVGLVLGVTKSEHACKVSILHSNW